MYPPCNSCVPPALYYLLFLSLINKLFPQPDLATAGHRFFYFSPCMPTFLNSFTCSLWFLCGHSFHETDRLCWSVRGFHNQLFGLSSCTCGMFLPPFRSSVWAFRRFNVLCTRISFYNFLATPKELGRTPSLVEMLCLSDPPPAEARSRTLLFFFFPTDQGCGPLFPRRRVSRSLPFVFHHLFFSLLPFFLKCRLSGYT